MLRLALKALTVALSAQHVSAYPGGSYGGYWGSYPGSFYGASTVSKAKGTCPTGIPAAGRSSVCAPFASVLEDLQTNVFNHTCGRAATSLIRLSFHDAVGYSLSGQFQGGGADGSILTFRDTELSYKGNIGISVPVSLLVPVQARHPQVTAGDLIQFAGAVALTNCPGAPRIEFLAGRPDATAPASDGTVPIPFSDADALLTRLADIGMSPAETVALLASHSVAHAPSTDPSLTGANTGQLDTTPAKFDTEFFLETLLKGVGYPGNGSNAINEVESPLPKQNVVRLESDFALAHDNRTACTWQGYINKQDVMTAAFKAAMAKMAVIGHDRSTLTDCSYLIPTAKALSGPSVTYPSGLSASSVNQTCPSPLPSLF